MSITILTSKKEKNEGRILRIDMHKMSMGSFRLTPPNVTMTPTGKKEYFRKLQLYFFVSTRTVDNDNHYTFSVSLENKRKIES